MEGRKEELTFWHSKFEMPVRLAGGAVMQAIKCEFRAQKRGWTCQSSASGATYYHGNEDHLKREYRE